MKKRTFIKKLSLATLGTPLYASALASSIAGVSNTTPKLLAANDEFWAKIREDYKLKPEYINLESGYYNIIPTPTLEALHEHINRVNYQGSYYMRTEQWDNKDRMANKLAMLLGSTKKNVIITRNTTESLDMVIKGMDWSQGDHLYPYGILALPCCPPCASFVELCSVV